MHPTDHTETNARIAAALTAADPSVRLRAALTAGTRADPGLVATLIGRCATEPDFYVRDMLTWALCRYPADRTVPHLLDQLTSDLAQARSQALHTLSKIGDGRAWPAVAALLRDDDTEVARSAWRAAVVLVPEDEKLDLAANLAAALGSGGRATRLSLSRALAALGDTARPALDAAAAHPDPRIRAHAAATDRLVGDPDSGFHESVEMAKRASVLE